MEYASDISNQEFDKILYNLVVENVNSLLTIPGIYEILAEHFNNHVLNIYEKSKTHESQ